MLIVLKVISRKCPSLTILWKKMLKPQTILQKKLQTANVVNDYWKVKKLY